MIRIGVDETIGKVCLVVDAIAAGQLQATGALVDYVFLEGH